MTVFVGSSLRLARLFHGLSLVELGEIVGVSKQYLSRVENGAESVAPNLEAEMAHQLGVHPEFFRHSDPHPITEEQCHFRRQLTTKVSLRQVARARGEILKRLIGVLDEHVHLPHYAMVEADANSPEAIERAAELFRSKLGLGLGPISNMTRLAERSGAVVMRLNGLASEIDAISFATRRPLIALNAVGRSPCRERFGIAHELGHFALHIGVLTGDKLTEAQANRFASSLLLPRSTFAQEYRQAIRGSGLSWRGLSELKLRWGVSKAAFLYRGHQLGFFSDQQLRSGFMYLNRHGEATAEHEDELVSREEPEIVNDSLQIMSSEVGMPLASIARKIHVSAPLAASVLGLERPPSAEIVSMRTRIQ